MSHNESFSERALHAVKHGIKAAVKDFEGKKHPQVSPFDGER
jgi:hypothetical protein